jgi:hypothetical protein
MRWSERQRIVEEAVDDVIDELACEFNLEIPYYPEVWWCGKPLKFDDTRLLERYREDFEWARKNKSSLYLYRPGVVLVNQYLRHHIAEEATHFLHFVNARPTFYDKTPQERFFLNIFVEMLGFFGSKVVNSDREAFPAEIDLMDYPLGERQRIFNEDPEYWIHQQGYELGDRLYYSYISGEIMPETIQGYFSYDFKKKNSSAYVYFGLRAQLGYQDFPSEK